MIPEDWQESNLSEVLKDFTTGATPYRGVKDFYSGNIPWVSSGELNYNYIKDTNEHITEDARQKTNLKLYPSGTFLMAITGLEAEGTRGKCAILGTSATTNQSCLALSSTEKMSVEYWFYFYQFWGDWYAFRFSQGTKQQSYKADIVKKFPVVYPKNKQEQSRIAEALSDIDKLIATLSKMIEKKRLMKQGAMQQLLTRKKRLPGFEGEWVEKRVGELLTIGNGRDYKHLKSGYVPVVGTGGVMAYVNDWLYDGETVCIGRKGTINKPIFYRGKIWTVDTLFYTYDFINTSPKYLYYLFDTIDWLSYNEATGVPSLSKANIEKISVYLPHNIAEQSAIANVLTTMDNEIESLEEERNKYVQVKDGMMQKLLTGQIRLVETEAKVVAMPKAKSANVHFKRSVLAAEIANRMCEEPTFGHVKMEKLIFLTEHLCHIDTGSHYHRDAAGPYDNTALRSIDKQMKQHQWFALTKNDKGYRYQPMDKRGDHKKYFDKYYAAVLPMFDKVIETFKTSSTEQCEIVATLYSAWDDLQHRNQPFTDDDILNEVLNHWHESKKRIPRSRWQKALDWMRKNGFVPSTN